MALVPPAGAAALERDHLGRREPSFARDATDLENPMFWEDFGSVPSAAGVRVSQSTAMQVSTVFACVSYISYDLAKLGAEIFQGARRGEHQRAPHHFLAPLLRRPAPWLTWFEFCAMLQMSVLLKGNGYAVILRNGGGWPVMLVPINPDKVALWEAPDGSLFYNVTRTGLHELAILKDQPLLIPAEDMFHLKSLSANGLLGLSPIALEREGIGLALAQEQVASRWMRNGAHNAGTLQTDQKLDAETRKALREGWRQINAGILNSGNIAILEAGTKFNPLTLNLGDLQFIAMRQFQVEELARIFRVPLYMLTEVKGARGTVGTQAQEYLNYSLSTWIEMWEQRIAFTFEIGDDGYYVDFDEDRLLQADIGTRYQANRVALGGMGWETPNEIRAKEGKAPVDSGDVLYRPANMVPIDSDVVLGTPDPNDPSLTGPGSDKTGQGADGGGRPHDDGTDAAPQDI